MAQADQHTSSTSFRLSIVKDVFPRWHTRLGSSKAAKDELEALLRSAPSQKRQVNFINGKKIRGVMSPDFWKNNAYLSVQTDVDGTDHLKVHYTEYDPSLSEGQFFVRAVDVEERERRYLPTPTSLPAPSKEKAEPGPLRNHVKPPASTQSRGKLAKFMKNYKGPLTESALTKALIDDGISVTRTRIRAALPKNRKRGRPKKSPT